MSQNINISTSTIFRFILIILGLVFVFLIRDILLMIFIAVIIAAAIDGPVDWLAARKVRRALGTVVVYLLVFLALLAFIYFALPPLAGQLKILAVNLPAYLDKIGTDFSVLQQKIGAGYSQKILEEVSSQLSGATSNIFGTAINIFGGIFSAFIILVISIYLVVQDKGIKRFLSSVTPADHRPYVVSLAERIQSKLGSWLRGQLMLMIIIAILVFVGLAFLKVNFALTLALLAGLMELIPYIGPLLAGAAAVTVAFLQAPLLSLLVFILFLVIHQLEGYVIVPQLMKRVVGLNPLVVIISMTIGAKLGGILGIAVSVPIVAAASVFFGDIFAQKQEK